MLEAIQAKEVRGEEVIAYKTGQERRIQPRVDKILPLKVVANGYDFSTTTKNVSCIGAYCRINKYMPPFTKVMVRLSLPLVDERLSKNYNVECRGVIVRTEDEREDGFNIAIFFNDIKENMRQKISRYVNQFIS